jgi:hypothetical protein
MLNPKVCLFKDQHLIRRYLRTTLSGQHTVAAEVGPAASAARSTKSDRDGTSCDADGGLWSHLAHGHSAEP